MTQSRIMVCGGAGFVGSHLVDRLLAQGAEIDVVDNLSSGSLSNLADARQSGGKLKFQHVDILGDSFAELVSLRRPDVLYLLNTFAPSNSQTTGAMTAMASAIAVLEAARIAGVAKVITTLPAKLLYGEVAVRDLPIKEGHMSESRSVPEIVARAIADMHSVYRDLSAVEYTVLATGHAYGPRQRANDGVVAAFIDAHMNGRAPVLHGTGKQSRDFIFIDDVVDALVRAIDRAGGLVVNVGTGEQLTIRDVWKAIAGSTGLTPRSSAARPSDIARLAVSPVRARIQLGWSPFTSFEDGLATTRGAWTSAE